VQIKSQLQAPFIIIQGKLSVRTPFPKCVWKGI